MKNNVLIGALLLLLGAGGTYLYLAFGRGSQKRTPAPPTPVAGMCAEHRIAEKDCPWCDPSLIEKKGPCPEHGVPEALCSRCNPTLIAGFKAENDWCAGHNVPESQCNLCKSGQLPPGEKK